MIDFFCSALIMRQFPSRVHKLNVELYKLQAIETNYAERRALQAACVAVKKKKKRARFFQLLHPSASLRVRVCPAGVNVLARGRYFVVNVHFSYV